MIRPDIFCNNIECGAIIKNLKSSKRKFCSDQCRNRQGFLLRKEKNKNIDLYVSKLKALEKLLNHLLEYNIFRINREDMEESLFKKLTLPNMESKLIEGKYVTGITVGNIFIEALKATDQKWYYFRKIE